MKLHQRKFFLLDLTSLVTQTSIYFIPIGFLFIGLVGSIHCSGMCGGLIALCSQKKENLTLYHVGRLISYLYLYFLFKILGGAFFSYIEKNGVAIVMGFACFLCILYFLLEKFFPVSFKLFFRRTKLIFMGKIVSGTNKKLSSFLIGLFTFLLPCGYLYLIISFIVLIPNTFLQLFTLIAFWLGSLPGMTLAGKLLADLFRNKTISPLFKSTVFAALYISMFLLRTPLKEYLEIACH